MTHTPEPTLITDSTEIWADIPGYEGVYQACTTGAIRSLDRAIRDKNGRRTNLTGTVLTPIPAGKGIHQIMLRHQGRSQRMTVQAAVMAAFVGPRPQGAVILHLDGDPLNNTLANLRYGTRAQSRAQARERGTLAGMDRADCPQGHELTQPNLVLSQLTRGHRSCLACHRAHSQIRYHGLDRARMQEISDEHHRHILAGTTARVPASHCSRGHALTPPNLVTGRRGCLSCNRAHGYSARHPQHKTPEGLQALSDRYYAKLGIDPATKQG